MEVSQTKEDATLPAIHGVNLALVKATERTLQIGLKASWRLAGQFDATLDQTWRDLIRWVGCYEETEIFVRNPFIHKPLQYFPQHQQP